jgi:hypothetical protein
VDFFVRLVDFFIKITYNFAIVNPNVNIKILKVKRTFLWRFKSMGKSCALLAHHGSTTNLVSTELQHKVLVLLLK